MSHWIVVTSQPRREDWARENIEKQGAVAYVPKVAHPSNPNKTTPLFPRYMFVDIEPVDGQWVFLTGTFGVSGVILRGDEPAPIRAIEIDAIRSREDEFGLVKLPSAPEVTNPFARGERLRVAEGPFLGSWGICEGMSSEQRVYVLLNMLGRRTRVELDVDQVERGKRRRRKKRR